MTNESNNEKFAGKTQHSLLTTNPEFSTNLLALYAEVTDFTKRALDMHLAFAEKVLGAASPKSAFEAQSEYAKTYFQGGVAQATKIGELCSNLATSAFTPIARASIQQRGNLVR